ncbi:hypothetical protein [Vulcanisaeta moutnovskia]|nr:hypothetical protein [Vulcanisaeta moutnovskia]
MSPRFIDDGVINALYTVLEKSGSQGDLMVILTLLVVMRRT